ncbi:MAG: hypothetical protein HS109_20165 [Burkholderiales bacterium]|nr:hypothetical protein [Burkholderiales bacterium]
MSARLVYRPLGRSGEPYPDWVRALKGKSGAYVIKAVGLFSSTIVYVGESHSGRLYETMTRHFQSWRRGKGWWFGQFVQSDNDPGTTYDREACEVAVRITRRDTTVVLAAQAELIRKLKPRDNVLGTSEAEADLEEAPF